MIPRSDFFCIFTSVTVVQLSMVCLIKHASPSCSSSVSDRRFGSDGFWTPLPSHILLPWNILTWSRDMLSTALSWGLSLPPTPLEVYTLFKILLQMPLLKLYHNQHRLSLSDIVSYRFMCLLV